MVDAKEICSAMKQVIFNDIESRRKELIHILDQIDNEQSRIEDQLDVTETNTPREMELARKVDELEAKYLQVEGIIHRVDDLQNTIRDFRC